MRLSRFFKPLLLSAIAISLAGCSGVDIKPVPFAGNLAIYLVILVAVASPLGTLMTSKSLAVGATVFIALVLSGLTTFVTDKFFKPDKLDLGSEAIKFLALLSFAIAMIMGGVLAMLLVELDPNISIYAFVVTSIIAIFITLGVYAGLIKTPEHSKFNDNLIFILTSTGFAIWSGSLLSLGFLYGNKVASILVILGGVGSVCFLCYRAWSTEEMRPKVGVYTVAAILTYELWLFVKRVIGKGLD